MLHKFNNRFFKDDYTLAKECYMHTVYHMFDCLRIYIKVHSTFFKLQYVSRGELPTPKGVILKIWFVVLQKYHIMHSEK